MTRDKIKVLILEDQSTDQQLIKRHVSKYNPSAIFAVANNRARFFEVLDWYKPDVITVDYKLSDINGLEALLFLKTNFPDIPVLFLTGTLNSQEEVAETILRGADGYLLKENMNDLGDKLAEIMDANENRIALFRAKAKKEQEKQLLMQKLEERINALADDPVKQELTSIIHDIKAL